MRRFLGRFGIVLTLTIGVLFLPTPAGLSAEGHRAPAAIVFTAGILALEPVSLPIAALMVPAALVPLGVATAPQAFETFSRPLVFLILAGLVHSAVDLIFAKFVKTQPKCFSITDYCPAQTMIPSGKSPV
jgi:hypothetical protein